MQCITYSHSTHDLFRHILSKRSCCILAAYSNTGLNVLFLKKNKIKKLDTLQVSNAYVTVEEVQRMGIFCYIFF